MKLTSISKGHTLFLLILLCHSESIKNRSLQNTEDETEDRTEIWKRPVVNTSELLDILLSKQDVRIRPNVDNEPIDISIGIYVVNFGGIDEVKMEYQLDMYFRQKWHDSRLNFELWDYHSDETTIDHTVISKVWTPDTFFPNEKDGRIHDVTVRNELMRVYRNGTIIYSMRLSLRLHCRMDLRSFPMDEQRCFLHIETYSKTVDDMKLSWIDGVPIVLDSDLRLPRFHLNNIKTWGIDVLYTTGMFSRITASFYLEREYGFHILQTFVPTMLIVILSWVSFWVNADAVPARVTLGVTTVLTMATQLSGSKNSIPKISYPKAIDIWMTTCMLFVFCALLEYAFVNALTRNYDNKQLLKKRKNQEGSKEHADEMNFESSLSSNSIPSVRSQVDSGFAKYERRSSIIPEEIIPRKLFRAPKALLFRRDAATTLDHVSRVLFPVIFFSFALVFWIVFTRPRIIKDE